MAVMRHKEAIHSGHFMVSDFEADDVAEEDDVDFATAEGDEAEKAPIIRGGSVGVGEDDEEARRKAEAADAMSKLSQVREVPGGGGPVSPDPEPGGSVVGAGEVPPMSDGAAIASMRGIVSSSGDVASSSRRMVIDISLKQLFKRMSNAYRHNFTSPKWNKFRGLHLRWKDRIRLNNVIWRCWHQQFIKQRTTLLCAFANPLEIDNHNCTEGGTLLEGKYWKRRMDNITSEYKKWRKFYKNRYGDAGEDDVDRAMELLFEKQPFQLLEGSKDDAALSGMFNNDNFLFEALLGENHNGFDAAMNPSSGFGHLAGDMFDNNGSSGSGGGGVASTAHIGQSNSGGVSSTVSADYGHLAMNSVLSVPFPKANVIRGTTNADFIQPGLVQLQPNLEDILSMDFDLDSQHGWPQEAPEAQPQSETHQQTQVVHVIQKPPLPMQYPQMQQTPSPNPAPPAASPSPNLTTLGLEVVNYDQHHRQQHLPQQQQHGSAPRQQHIAFPLLAQQPHHATVATNYANSFSMAHSNANLNDITATGPAVPPCSKRNNSPKHKILRHRAYDSVHTGVSSAPYKILPDSVNSATFSEARVRTRSQSAAATVTTTSTASKSELLELLRDNTDKYRNQPGLRPILSKPNVEQLETSNLEHNAIVGSARSEQHSFPRSQDFKQEPFQQSIAAPPPQSPPIAPLSAVSPSYPSVFGGRNSSPSPPLSHRREVHTNAEQRRRGSLKNGFEQMRALIPSLRDNANLKISKAALLQKGGEHLQQLKEDRVRMAKEAARLRAEADALHTELAAYQGALSSRSAAASGPSTASTLAASQGVMQSYFEEHVRRMTMQNWKYWVFSTLMEPLLASFNNAVGLPGHEHDMNAAARSWVNQHLRLVQLRPMVLGSLKRVAVQTQVLERPAGLPEEAVAAVTSSQALWPSKRRRLLHDSGARGRKVEQGVEDDDIDI